MPLTLTNADIISRFSKASNHRGKATSGTINTLVYDRVTFNGNYSDNYFNGMYICFLSGANKGIDRIITNYTSSTGTFTFEAVSATIDNTTEFAIVENGFLSYMQDAFSFIQEKVKNDGKDIDLFLTTSQLKELHLYKTLDLICQDKYEDADDDDMYYNRHVHYKDLFNSTYTALKADYDENEDGEISDDEKLQGGSYGKLRK